MKKYFSCLLIIFLLTNYHVSPAMGGNLDFLSSSEIASDGEPEELHTPRMQELKDKSNLEALHDGINHLNHAIQLALPTLTNFLNNQQNVQAAEMLQISANDLIETAGILSQSLKRAPEREQFLNAECFNQLIHNYTKRKEYIMQLLEKQGEMFKKHPIIEHYLIGLSRVKQVIDLKANS